MELDRRMSKVFVHHACRSCRAPFEEVLNLGALRLNSFPKHPHEADMIPRVDLILCVCTVCGLAQLKHTTPPDWLYREYWYRSGVNEMMVAELRDIVEEVQGLVPLHVGDYVLDIGANDGTLLAQYATVFHGHPPMRVGVEPAHNLQEPLRQHSAIAVHDYFPSKQLENFGRTYKVITAIAMAYDLEDPVQFFHAIRSHLHPEGIAVVQFQDLGQMLATTAFDNICHEHLEYYTLHSLTPLVLKAGLVITKCTKTPINGGSLRVHLRRVRNTGGHWPTHPSVRQQYAEERAIGLDTVTLSQGHRSAFDLFRTRITAMVDQIQAVLAINRGEGVVTDVYGASTKGNILLQVLQVGPGTVRQAIDRSPAKVGFHTITGIPIVSETTAKVLPADVWLCPIWQFRPSVLQRERWYLQRGGRIIFPLPQCEVVAETWRASA